MFRKHSTELVHCKLHIIIPPKEMRSWKTSKSFIDVVLKLHHDRAIEMFKNI